VELHRQYSQVDSVLANLALVAILGTSSILNQDANPERPGYRCGEVRDDCGERDRWPVRRVNPGQGISSECHEPQACAGVCQSGCAARWLRCAVLAPSPIDGLGRARCAPCTWSEEPASVDFSKPAVDRHSYRR
jgi:hypothetical protein